MIGEHMFMNASPLVIKTSYAFLFSFTRSTESIKFNLLNPPFVEGAYIALVQL